MNKTIQYLIETLPEVTTGLWEWPKNITKPENSINNIWPINFSSEKERLRSACLQYISEQHRDKELIIKFSNSDGFCVKYLEDNVVRWWCFEFDQYRLEKQTLIHTRKETDKVKLK